MNLKACDLVPGDAWWEEQERVPLLHQISVWVVKVWRAAVGWCSLINDLLWRGHNRRRGAIISGFFMYHVNQTNIRYNMYSYNHLVHVLSSVCASSVIWISCVSGSWMVKTMIKRTYLAIKKIRKWFNGIVVILQSGQNLYQNKGPPNFQATES